jgi:hypothetical protein
MMRLNVYLVAPLHLEFDLEKKPKDRIISKHMESESRAWGI